VVLEVTPGSGVPGWEPSDWRWPVVRYTWGQFIDTASLRSISGQFGDDFAVNVFLKPRLAYVPLVMRNLDTRPDLVVVWIGVDPNDPAGVEVTIANQGRAPAQGFWVDLYLDPTSPPETNYPWPNLGCIYGIAWFVQDLPPGAELPLAVGDAFYRDMYSRWPEAYPSGAHDVWAYVDVWAHPQSHGAVDEADEGNNRYGPVSFNATGSGWAGPERMSLEPVPPRPLRPEGGK